jgi:DNA polymerase-3 subunit epsilon
MSDLAWHRGPLLAWDLETTGPNPDTARIVTATIIEIGREGIERTTEWLVNPGIPIPLGASEIHGITTERAVRDGQDPEPAVFEIMAQIGLWMGRGRPALAFNASYDFTVLDRECRRYRIDTLSRRMGDVAPVIDPYVIDKHVDRYRKGKRTVTAMAEHYGVTLDDAHTSSADALAAARIAFKQAERYPNEVQMSLPLLHTRQRAYRHEQCMSLQSFFRKTDPTAVVDPHWPLHPLPADWTPDLVDVEDQAAAS